MLFAPDDPPPFLRLDPPAPGDAARPLLLVCDHASRAVPRRLDRLGLDETVLMRHIGWDIGAAEVARGLGRTLAAPVILSGYSRLVVDCNRFPDTAGAIPETSDAVAVPGNHGLRDDDRAARVAACFAPYHAAIAAALVGLAAGETVPAIVSIHSFTPVMEGFVRPWHAGVLWDRDPRLARPLLAGLAAEPGLVIGDNQPYSAREPVGYTLRHHAEGTGLAHVLIELRQDLVDTPSGVAGWVARLSRVLRPILADPTLYHRVRF